MKPLLLSSTICLGLMVSACGRSPTPPNGAATNASQPQTEAPLPSAPPPPALQHVDLPAGLAIVVRLGRALSTARNRTGDTFDATLDEAIAVNGQEVIPRGTRFRGRVTTSHSSGRLEGRAVLGITLDGFDLNGERYTVVTSLDAKTTEAHKKRNIELIGGGTGVGALIGGLVGHGKGAALGAVLGGAAGTGTAAATGRVDIEVPAETVFRFALKQIVTITT